MAVLPATAANICVADTEHQEFTAGAPMEMVHVDILGALPETSRKNKYMLLAVCQFSKWIEDVALPDQKAETIAEALVNQFFSRMGCTMEIVSERGSNFCSQLFQIYASNSAFQGGLPLLSAQVRTVK